MHGKNRMPQMISPDGAHFTAYTVLAKQSGRIGIVILPVASDQSSYVTGTIFYCF